MSQTQEFQARDVAAGGKRELAAEERTFAGKTFTPATDIFETETALWVLLDMPGVSRDGIEVRVENDRLEIEGRIGAPASREVLYSEYNVGNFYRRFSLSNKIARDKIEARMQDGVLSLTLPKIPEATPRRVPVS